MSNSYRGYALALLVDVWEIGTVLAAVISSGTSLPAHRASWVAGSAHLTCGPQFRGSTIWVGADL